MLCEFVKVKITVLMGGCVAEEIVFGRYIMGVANDIKQVFVLVCRMVVEFGMSDEFGSIVWGSEDDMVFLGCDIINNRCDYFESTVCLIDEEIKRIIREVEQWVRSLLSNNRELFDKMVGVFLEREMLDVEEIDVIVVGCVLLEWIHVKILIYWERAEVVKEKCCAVSIFGVFKLVLS